MWRILLTAHIISFLLSRHSLIKMLNSADASTARKFPVKISISHLSSSALDNESISAHSTFQRRRLSKVVNDF